MDSQWFEHVDFYMSDSGMVCHANIMLIDPNVNVFCSSCPKSRDRVSDLYVASNVNASYVSSVDSDDSVDLVAVKMFQMNFIDSSYLDPIL